MIENYKFAVLESISDSILGVTLNNLAQILDVF